MIECTTENTTLGVRVACVLYIAQYGMYEQYGQSRVGTTVGQNT
jgi:hypothetical protein